MARRDGGIRGALGRRRRSAFAQPEHRGGVGRALLHAVIDAARALDVRKMFLEVRASNAAARALYAQAGFREIGVRRDYYPAHGGREDAIVLEFVPEYFS
jgi:[ribosomal protein S18]-alanine N-acetyltransferase